MNRSQAVIWIVGLLVVLAMLALPPYQTAVSPWFLASERFWDIDFPALLYRCVVVLILTAITSLVFRRAS